MPGLDQYRRQARRHQSRVQPLRERPCFEPDPLRHAHLAQNATRASARSEPCPRARSVPSRPPRTRCLVPATRRSRHNKSRLFLPRCLAHAHGPRPHHQREGPLPRRIRLATPARLPHLQHSRGRGAVGERRLELRGALRRGRRDQGSPRLAIPIGSTRSRRRPQPEAALVRQRPQTKPAALRRPVAVGLGSIAGGQRPRAQRWATASMSPRVMPISSSSRSVSADSSFMVWR